MLPKFEKKKEMRVKFRMPFLNVMKNLVSVESLFRVLLKKTLDANLLKYDPVFHSYTGLRKPVLSYD